MKKIKVAVVFGGPSSEHEVSLKSAENVIKNLDITKFEFLQIKISREGIWIDQETGKQFSESEGVKYLKISNVDMVFIIIHGEYGEDGTIQALLESEGLKYSGSDSRASKAAMDKALASSLFMESGLTVPSFIAFRKKDWIKNPQEIIEKATLPAVVKPTDRGSSVGVVLAKDKEDLITAINEALKFSENVMIQEYIEGRELTCGVIENGKADIPLTPTEIIPKSADKLFDYNSKYIMNASIEITPPDLPDETIKRIQEAALAAHQIINCRHISRTDFMLKDNVLYILEINTLPGLTKTSLLPQGAKDIGIEFPTLVEIIIEAALR